MADALPDTAALSATADALADAWAELEQAQILRDNAFVHDLIQDAALGSVPAAIARALRPVIVVLENKYYLDWFNENVLARGARALGVGLWKGGDRGVIEGGVVNASWKLVGVVSSVVRRAQTGYLYHYALMMIVGVWTLRPGIRHADLCQRVAAELQRKGQSQRRSDDHSGA